MKLLKLAPAMLGGCAILALAACGGGEEGPSAEEAAAARKAQYEEQLMVEGIDHNVRCLSAIRWQEGALRRANIGDLDVYRAYYRGAIEKKLGETVIPGDPPKPELSIGNLDAYLDWAYADDVATEFRPDDDFSRGKQIVGACIQEVAEMGEGPLAGPDMTDRMFKIEAVRNALEDKGA